MANKSIFANFSIVAFCALWITANAASYKCRDDRGNWTERACQSKAEPTESVAQRKLSSSERLLLMDTIGCRQKAQLQKFADYKSDQEALNQYVALMIASGECTTFDKGEIALYVDSAFFDEMVKLRRKGNLFEFWTVRQAVVADKAVAAPK